MIDLGGDEVWQRAVDLADQGLLPDAVQLLVAAKLTGRAARFLDDHVPALLSRARYSHARSAIVALPEAHRTLMLRIALADALWRDTGVSATDIERLITHAAQERRPDLLAWASAILVEQLVLQGDLGAVGLAHQYLEELPDDPRPQALFLQARGRLRRIVSLGCLTSGPGGESIGRQEIERAMADCRRAGWTTEVWLCVSFFYLFSTALSGSVPEHVVHALKEARDQLIALDSSQVHFGRYAVLHAAFYLGDRQLLREELAALRKLDLTGDPVAMPILGAHLDAIAEAVLGGRPQAMRRLGNADDLRRAYPAMIGSVLARAAHAFLDLGQPADAAVWYGRLMATPSMLPHDVLEREVLSCRLALVSASAGAVPVVDPAVDPAVDTVVDPAVADRLLRALRQVTESGYPRVAGGLALRTSRDAARAGLTGLGDTLRAQAQTLLPPPAQRTAWELFWGSAYEFPPEPIPAAVTGIPQGRSLRVLGPALEVTVDGEQRRLAPSAARLLLVLAGRGRALGAQELAGLLWGDIDESRARGRLKSAVHRLRQSLSLGPDELVVRTGDVVRLVEDPRWTVDLHDFNRLLAGDGADQLAAYRLVDGLLCAAQFPYDDAFAAERDVLAARWTALTRSLISTGTLPEAEALQQAQRIGIHLEPVTGW